MLAFGCWRLVTGGWLVFCTNKKELQNLIL